MSRTSSSNQSVRESVIVKRILDYLRSRGAYAEKLHGGAYQPTVLDIVACYRGYFVAIEVKRPNIQLTPRQEFTQDQIERAGGIAMRADSVEPIRELLDRLDDIGSIH